MEVLLIRQPKNRIEDNDHHQFLIKIFHLHFIFVLFFASHYEIKTIYLHKKPKIILKKKSRPPEMDV